MQHPGVQPAPRLAGDQFLRAAEARRQAFDQRLQSGTDRRFGEFEGIADEQQPDGRSRFGGLGGEEHLAGATQQIRIAGEPAHGIEARGQRHHARER